MVAAPRVLRAHNEPAFDWLQHEWALEPAIRRALRGPAKYDLEPFETEAQASTRLRELLAPHFAWDEQVWLTHLDGSVGRIDFVVRPLPHTRVHEHSQLVGIEVKRSPRDLADHAKALAQCIDYEHARITDQKVLPYAQGCFLDYVFLYPAFPRNIAPIDEKWMKQHCDNWYRHAYSAERVAGQMRVGVVSEYWNDWTARYELVFRVSGNPFWTERNGPYGGASWGRERKRFSR